METVLHDVSEREQLEVLHGIRCTLLRLGRTISGPQQKLARAKTHIPTTPIC